MRRFLLVVACSAAPCLAQSCNAGEVLLKNDNLPAIPSSSPVSIIQGLCEGEACAAVFDTTALGGVKVNMAAVGYINAGNANGIQAAADLEIFDGCTFSGAVANVGPSLFRWSAATGSSIGLVSSGINIGPDLTSYNIVATSGKLVVAWWMDFNPQGGTCAAGYQTNFATDYGGGSGGLVCNPAYTPQHKNLLYISGQGWRDASLATVQGIPLCPIYYSGNWIIRCCIEQPPVLQVFGPNPPPAGSYLTMQYSSVSNPNQAYTCGLSLGTNPGIAWPPYGTIPLNDDFALQFMIPDILELPGAGQNWAINFTGSLNAGGVAFGTFQVPPVPGISGVTIYFAFILPNAGRISNAASITVL